MTLLGVEKVTVLPNMEEIYRKIIKAIIKKTFQSTIKETKSSYRAGGNQTHHITPGS